MKMVAYKSKLKLFAIFGKYLSLINNVQFQPLLTDEIESWFIDDNITDNKKSKISLNLNFPMFF